MLLAFPVLMVAALLLAATAAVWLLRPRRRKLLVSHLAIWRESLEAVGRRRPQRRWRPRLLLSALGGLLLASSVGGWTLRASRSAPAAPAIIADSPGRDVALVAAGAELTADGVQVFAAVERLVGWADTADVVVLAEDGTGPDTPGPATAVEAARPLARAAVSLMPAGWGGAVVTLPADFRGPIRVALSAGDDQPANDSIRLDPPAGRRQPITVQLVGRPNEAILRAIRSSDRMAVRRIGQGQADWLVVNEPSDPVSPAPGQRLVVIDPLVAPLGVSVIGQVEGATVRRQVSSPPWDFPLDGVKARRLADVQLGPGWQKVASDESDRPMIAVNHSAGVLAIFFSVAPDNTDWPSMASWPIFWDALAGLGGGPGPLRWTASETAAVVADKTPAPADQSTDAITLPPSEPVRQDWPIWPAMALLGALLITTGWRIHRPAGAASVYS